MSVLSYFRDMIDRVSSTIYEFSYRAKNTAEEEIAKRYLIRIQKRFLRNIEGQEISVLDSNKGCFKIRPRWHMVIRLDSSDSYYELYDKWYNVFAIRTFFPNAVKRNAFVMIFVKNHNGHESYRYIPSFEKQRGHFYN